MKYLYYPGCSAEATGKAYDVSARAVMEKLGVELEELDDWNCCGATSYFSVRELDSFAIAARNMAIAQKQGAEDLCVICNACYTTLAKANRYMAESPEVFKAVNGALGAVGRSYDGNVNVRHMMDILINDVGLEAIEARVTRRLTGIRVAPYYGCQFSRPHGSFDDVQFPTTMDRLFQAMGADVITDWDAKTDCCGGMMMLTKRDGALRLCHELLVAARQYKADVVVAACPLCEMNLEGYQRQVNQAFGTDFDIPVMYFTQLAGLALGADPKQLAIDKQVVSCEPVLAAIPA
ncbi:MAG TPA: CoB--CoM heterodisulfide reductase iron-sulfur subunit B family protein [Thermoleophilia bacterium]|nr:CoB--CoM heterodisulfide reductase iron-sulfur subunit B family protein [Thermoleophilia bacterium]